MKRRLAAFSLFLAGSLAVGAEAQDPLVDTLVIKAHTRFLAHDLLQGRGTGTHGNHLAALYIESQCRLLGLVPIAGDFTLPVPLESATVLPDTRLVLGSQRGTLDFLHPFDFIPNLGTKHTMRGFSGPAVFVGSEADVKEGSTTDLALENKVAVTVGPFRGAAADTLVARGAVGMVHLVGKTESLDLFRRSRGDARIACRGRDCAGSRAVVDIYC